VTADNPLEKYFRDNRLIHKWMHYFDVYHRHFERFRGQPIVLVEFGVSQGGSLQMWRDYFGDQATIYGVDIDERWGRHRRALRKPRRTRHPRPDR